MGRSNRPGSPGGPTTLREAIRQARPAPDACFSAPGTSVPLGSIAEGTSLAEGAAALSGRSVMLVTRDQLGAALAVVDLDGLVGRMILCPPDLAADHRATLLADGEAEAIVTDHPAETFAGLGLPVVQCGLPVRPLTGKAPPARATEWVLATSGTAGAPKLVVHDLRALTAAIKPIAGPDDQIVWATFYDIRRYGGLQIFLRAVLGGRSLVLSQAGEPLVDHIARLQQAGVTHLSGTPSHWRRLLMSAEAGGIAPGYVRLSGEIADQAVLDGLRDTFPDAKLGHAYASTEAGVGFEVNDGLEGFPASYLDGVGECRMRIVDGSLRIRSDRMASRYLGVNPPALLDEDGFVETGDMVEQRGERCFFVGRRGGIINVGGLKVHPEEIEAVINRHAGVRMSLVRSRRSPITGAIVVADVVLEGAGEEAVLRDEILKTCRDSLASHKVPALLRFVPALDMTPAGKLSRTAPSQGSRP